MDLSGYLVRLRVAITAVMRKLIVLAQRTVAGQPPVDAKTA